MTAWFYLAIAEKSDYFFSEVLSSAALSFWVVSDPASFFEPASFLPQPLNEIIAQIANTQKMVLKVLFTEPLP